MLVDHSKRQMWDLNCIGASKIGHQGDHLKISYEKNVLGNKINSSVEVRYLFSETFLNGHTTYLIHEKAEDAEAFYEMTPILNRPGCIKLIYYATLTPEIFKARGKDLWTSLSTLRDFIHSSSIEVQASSP